MPKEKLPPAKDWENRPVEKWNTQTFMSYLGHKSVATFDIPYVPFRGGYGAESKLIKSMIDEHGQATTKHLIDVAYKEYKPNPNFPSLTFGFIYTYMRPTLLPRLIKEKQQKETIKKYQTQTSSPSIEEIDDWI